MRLLVKGLGPIHGDAFHPALLVHYRGRTSGPAYHCFGKVLIEGRGVYCLNIGGKRIDDAVAEAFIAALEPARLAATVAAAEQLETDHNAALKQWRLGDFG